MTSRLARSYQRRQQRLMSDAERRVSRLWGAVSADEFAALAARVDMGAEAASVALADGYMAEWLSAATGDRVEPLGVDPASVVRQVPHDERWQRPGKHARMSAARGGDPSVSGLAYARQLVRSDVQIAARGTWQRWTGTEGLGIVGYKRVLGGGKNCGLCIVASTQRYHRGDLMPIHANCQCAAEPIVGGSDPGHVVDGDRLNFVKERLDQEEYADTWGALRRSEFDVDDLPPVQVRSHGELGPVLVDPRHQFTGPRDLGPGGSTADWQAAMAEMFEEVRTVA